MLAPMPLEIDVFWSFRSPYSYLATGRLVELQRRFEVDVRVRPVLPIAVRTPEFFERVNPLWPPYLLRDIRRLGEFHGIPIAWPRPDPVVMDAGGYPAEQPRIHRLTRLGIAAAERERGLPFIDEVSRIIWNGEIEGWDQGDHLAEATARAGLDLAELDAAVADDPERHAAAIEANQEALTAAGHWGVPTLVFEGEPFFGQDRIDLLVWRLQQHGLKERS
jgi:2-hydroxychromene-2-carboxylate isomerase